MNLTRSEIISYRSASVIWLGFIGFLVWNRSFSGYYPHLQPIIITGIALPGFIILLWTFFNNEQTRKQIGTFFLIFGLLLTALPFSKLIRPNIYWFSITDRMLLGAFVPLFLIGITILGREYRIANWFIRTMGNNVLRKSILTVFFLLNILAFGFLILLSIVSNQSGAPILGYQILLSIPLFLSLVQFFQKRLFVTPERISYLSLLLIPASLYYIIFFGDYYIHSLTGIPFGFIVPLLMMEWILYYEAIESGLRREKIIFLLTAYFLFSCLITSYRLPIF